MADESSSFQCPVCFEDYKVNDRIWQCKSGHSICTTCRNKINECPFCKAPYEGTRNFAVEEIIRELNEESDEVKKLDGGNNSSTAPSAPEMDYNDTMPTVHPNTVRSSNVHGHVPPSQSWAPQNYSNYSSNTFLPHMVNAPMPNRQNFQNVWVDCYARDMPYNMAVGGQDKGNTPLYIGRARHGGDLIPGKVNPEYKLCYVAWNGEEIEKSDFQVLTNATGTWIKNSGGRIPDGALPGGYTENGETLYIGRAYVNGTLSIGKVHPSHGYCYVSYGGSQYAKRNYEIYVS